MTWSGHGLLSCWSLELLCIQKNQHMEDLQLRSCEASAETGRFMDEHACQGWYCLTPCMIPTQFFHPPFFLALLFDTAALLPCQFFSTPSFVSSNSSNLFFNPMMFSPGQTHFRVPGSASPRRGASSYFHSRDLRKVHNPYHAFPQKL